MYEINGGKARTDLYQKGLGDAHVWDFSNAERLIESHRRYQQAQIDAKQKAGDLNQSQALAELGKLNSKAVHPNDLQYFTDKQNQIRNDTVADIQKIRNNDPVAKANLLKRIADFNREADQSSQFARYAEAAHTGVLEAQKQGKTFTEDSLKAFDAAQEAPHSTNWDYTKINPKIDINLDEEIRKNLNPDLKSRADKIGVAYNDPTTGNIIKSDRKEITKDQAIQAQTDFLKSDPRYLEKANTLFSQQPAEVQNKYKDDQGNLDPAKWFATQKYGLSTFKDVDNSNLESSSSGAPTIEEGTPEKPLSYNITSTGVKGDAIPATVSVSARVTLPKPIKVVGANTENVRTVDGNVPLNAADVSEVEYGEVNTVPVYKAGTKAYIKQKDGSSKEVDIGGNVVPDEILAHGKKNDAIEYKNMVNGIATVNSGKTKEDASGNEIPIYEKVSVTKPASEIEGALKKSKVPLDKLNEKVDQLNKGLQNNSQGSASKEITKEEYDALPKGGKYMHGGKTFIKN